MLEKAEFNVRASCKKHNYLCTLNKKPDLSLFGAPCVDDSNMGAKQKDHGESRLVSRFRLFCCFAAPSSDLRDLAGQPFCSVPFF